MAFENSFHKTIELPLTYICTQVVFPELQRKGLGGQWEVKVQQDYMRDAIVANVMGYFASTNLIPEINIKYPKDWRESLKERFAPTWFLKKYPVNYIHHYAKVADLYPDFAVPKSLGRSVRIAEQRSWTSKIEDWQ